MNGKEKIEAIERIHIQSVMIAGDRADASVMTYLENWKAEMWAFDHMSEAEKVRNYNALRAHAFY